MQSTPFNKSKRILAILLSTAVLIGSNICTYIAANNKKNSNSGNALPGYYVDFHYDYDNYLNPGRFTPSVKELEDAELAKKINNNLKEGFYDWMPQEFSYPKFSSLSIPYSSDKYLSLKVFYFFVGSLTAGVNICNTIDMSTGEALYLDDIIEVDEELISMILTEGILKMDFDIWSSKQDVYCPQKHLDRKEPEQVFEHLQLCSVPFGDNDYWKDKPTFYLGKDRLYLLHILDEGDCFYIELDKISHKLKVDAW